MIKAIPNMLTLGSVGCGFATLINLMEGQYTQAMLWMFLAVAFDGVDGKIAKLLDVKNETGPILDSLADVVSFALLPGFSLYLLYQNVPEASLLTTMAAWVVGIGYTCAGLLRATRFASSQTGRTRGQGFIGLPSPPPAGLTVALISLANLFPDIFYNQLSLIIIFFIVCLNVYLMTISSINYLRWGKQGIAIQSSIALMLGLFTYINLGTLGAFLAGFFIAFCGTYIYSHLVLEPYKAISKQNETQYKYYEHAGNQGNQPIFSAKREKATEPFNK